MKKSKSPWRVASKESPLGNRIEYVIDPRISEETIFISYKINFATLYIKMYKGVVDNFVGTRMGEVFYFRNEHDAEKDAKNLGDAKKIVEEIRDVLGVEKILEEYDPKVLVNCFPDIESNEYIENYPSSEKSDLFDFLGIEKASQIRNFFLD